MADPKRPGRPPLDANNPSASLHLRLAPADYDYADRIAKQKRESIQDLIRRNLKRILTDERGG